MYFYKQHPLHFLHIYALIPFDFVLSFLNLFFQDFYKSEAGIISQRLKAYPPGFKEIIFSTSAVYTYAFPLNKYLS